MSYYQTRYTFDEGRDKVWRAIAEYLQRFIRENSFVLDLGSGYAGFINNIEAGKKYAVDINPEAEKNCAKDVIFINASSTNLEKIESRSIDTIFTSNLLEHLDSDQIEWTIREIKRVLKKSGAIIILQPNFRYAYKNYFDDFTHKSIFTHVSLGDLMKSHGFKVVLEKSKFLPLTLKSKFPKSYLLTKTYINSPIKPFGKQMLIIFRLENVE